jgi:glutamate synthase (NADPH/NADH) large chain
MTGGRVVILGPVGRNFAAGMSGGIAYVFDPDRQLEAQVNPGMVDLEAPDGSDDEATIRALVERHQRLTGSARAAAILAGWEVHARSFVKVMPREYRRVLDAGRRELRQLAGVGDD